MLLWPEHRFEKSHTVIVQNNTSDVSFSVTFLVCISCQFRVQGGYDHREIWKTLFLVSDPKVSEVSLICSSRTQLWQQDCDLWELVCTLVLSTGFAFWRKLFILKSVYMNHVIDSTYILQCLVLRVLNLSWKNASLDWFITNKPLKVILGVIKIFC